MDIDFSKFKSNKSEPSVKAESHSEKSIKKPEKDNSSPSIHDINKSDDKKETSKRKEFSKNDYTVLGAIQEETEKLSTTSIDSLYEKNKPKRLKGKNNRNNNTTASAKGQIVLDFGKQYDKYEGHATADDGKDLKKNADIFIKYVFGEDTYLHAGNKNKEDDVEGDEKTKKNNGDENATPWCASFVSYVLENSGIEVPEWYNSIEKEKKALVQNVYVAARDNDALIEKSEVKPGDLIMLDRDNTGWYDHIAFVKSIDEDGTIHTLEGNAPKKSKTEDGVETWKDDQGIVTTKTYPPNYEEKNNTTFAFARIN